MRITDARVQNLANLGYALALRVLSEEFPDDYSWDPIQSSTVLVQLDEDAIRALEWICTTLGCAVITGTGNVTLVGREWTIKELITRCRFGSEKASTVNKLLHICADKVFIRYQADTRIHRNGPFDDRERRYFAKNKVKHKVAELCPGLRDRTYRGPEEIVLLQRWNSVRLGGIAIGD